MAWPLVRKRQNQQSSSWMVDCGMVEGRRVRFFFKQKAEADTKAEQLRIERKNVGIAAFSLSDSERSLATECIQALQPFGKTLRDAVNFYLPHLKSMDRSVSFSQLKAEVIAAKKSDRLSDRYLQDVELKLNAFDASFGTRLVASIHAMDIDDWLRGLRSSGGAELSAITRNNFRRVLGVAFSFAVLRKYCQENPVPETGKAKETETAVGILTVAQLGNLLQSSAPTLIPYLAIAAFAGLRRAELERLDWEEVDIAGGFIEVKAKKAKSARRRLIKIRDNLALWLEPFKHAEGRVTPSNYRLLLDNARSCAGMGEWPQNALRHSFASYCLAFENDAGALALELGHTNSQLIFSHYRELVKAGEAKKYWQIVPKH